MKASLLPWICLSLLPVNALAVVDDAHSYALEAAESWVAKGVELRYDYARGTVISGTTKRVSCQVFKGNRYWFFLGGSEDGAKMGITVSGPDGKPLTGKSTKGNNSATFYFTAPRTMLVSIDITGSVGAGVEFNWALVYGFQAPEKSLLQESSSNP